MIIINRDAKRKIENEIGKDTCILAAAVAERSGGRVSPIQLEWLLWQLPKCQRPARVDMMRQWVRDFDAGIIVPDDEVDQ